MGEIVADQAEGLRRLLQHDYVRIVAVIGGRQGVGRTTAVTNIAVALARRGRRVLILDEQVERRNVDSMLGIAGGDDLLQVIRGKRTLAQVMRPGPDGVMVATAAQSLKALAIPDFRREDNLVRAFRQLSASIDVVLIDALSDVASNQLSFSLAAQEIVLMVSPSTASLTDAYALIKVLSRDFARRQFHILVNRVTNRTEGEAIFANLAGVAARFLRIQPKLVGWVPKDDKLRQASRLRRLVVDAFPDAPAATAFRRLAEAVDEWPYPKGETGRLDNFALRLIQRSRLTAECSND